MKWILILTEYTTSNDVSIRIRTYHEAFNFTSLTLKICLRSYRHFLGEELVRRSTEEPLLLKKQFLDEFVRLFSADSTGRLHHLETKLINDYLYLRHQVPHPGWIKEVHENMEFALVHLRRLCSQNVNVWFYPGSTSYHYPGLMIDLENYPIFDETEAICKLLEGEISVRPVAWKARGSWIAYGEEVDFE